MFALHQAVNATDTIVAISSAIGPAARMIVRLSGKRAVEIASTVLAEPPPRSFAGVARVRWERFHVPAWVYAFAGPRSSTGEDVVELHLPGNVILVRAVLKRLIEAGARQAEAGEFTARAYFNGKVDLTQAEGVAAAISAANESELRAARQLMAGELSRRIKPLVDALANALALVEVGIDFAEEDVTFLPPDELRRIVGAIDHDLADLVRESRRFDSLTHEPTIVLVGRPNAGKSTLLNALAGQPRAVVSPVAGTTRDVIWAEVALRDGMVRVIDVAGIELEPPPEQDASPQAEIARQMRHRAEQAVKSADVVVLVQDGAASLPPPSLDRAADLVVLSKSDLHSQVESAGSVRVSAHAGEGLDRLRDRLNSMAFTRGGGGALALNERHLRAIADARAAMTRARESATDTPEIVAMELRSALDSLGDIIGQVTPDDVLGLIFRGFCIGK